MAETMPTSVLVCGLPEAGRLHVQQRDGEVATLHDVYASGALLCALPAQPDEQLAAQLPLLVSLRASCQITHLLVAHVWRVSCVLRQCLPDGVSLRSAPPPPPCFFRTTVPRADGPALQLSCLQFYEPLRSASLVPLVMKVIAEGARSNPTPRPNAPTHAVTPPAVDGAFTQRRRRGHGSRSEAGSSSRSGSVDLGGNAEPSAAPSTPLPSARAAASGTPASGADTRRVKEVAMRELRARGYPLGVCAVALHQVGASALEVAPALGGGRAHPPAPRPKVVGAPNHPTSGAP